MENRPTGSNDADLREARRKRIVEGPIIPTLLWLATPMMMAHIVDISYSIVDSILLGRLGKAEFGASTITWPLVFLFFAIGMGFSQAGISVVSQLYGARRFQEAEKTASALLGFMIMLSLALTIPPITAAPSILALMGVPHDVLPHAIVYIRLILLGLPFALIYMTFVSISNSLGDTRTPTKLSITAATINIVLDPLLIFGLLGFPRLEVMGAAIATTVARIVVALAALHILATGKLGMKITLSLRALKEGGYFGKILRIGPYLSLQRSANSLGFVVMASIVSHFGSTAIAAYGVALRLLDILQVFNLSLSRATGIMVGQNIGAGKHSRAREIVTKSILLIASIMSLGAAAIYLLAPSVVKVFVNDPDVIHEGSRFIRILVPSIPFFSIFFMANAASTGSGRVKLFTVISLLRLWVFRIALGLLLAYQLEWGIDGIWLSISLSNIITGILALAWVMTTEWHYGIIGKQGTHETGLGKPQPPTTSNSAPQASETAPTNNTSR